MFEVCKLFVDLVEEESFTRAAEANFITRSAVSQRIKSLEDSLGHALVVRTGTGVVATDAGRIYYAACKDILRRHEQMRRQLEVLCPKVGGRLCVGAVTSVGLYGLTPFLKKYLELYPEVDVALEYLTSSDIYRGLNERGLEVGIVAFPGRDSRMRTIEFLRDELVAVFPASHHLSASAAVAPSRLHDEPFVAFEPQIPTSRVIERLLRRAGVRVRVVHRFDNVETIKRAVEIGAGVSIVPRETVEQEVSAGSLSRARLRGEGWTRPIAVLHLKAQPPSPAARAFIGVLTASK